MASVVTKVAAELPALRAVATTDASKAREIINRLKVLMTEFPSQAGVGMNAPAGDELAIGREVLELALLTSVTTGDMRSFERNFAQLRPYYAATVAAGAVPVEVVAGRQHVVGLYLIHLLVENRLAEFHSEVELLAPGDRESTFVAFPLQLETFLMEGNYTKIISCRDAAPSHHYLPFIAKLVDTARDDIADCAAVSYKSLSLTAAQQLMMFDSLSALSDYVRSSKPEWRVDGTTVHFTQQDKVRPEVESLTVLSNILGYATEMERIV
jgi:26S proteasome regulatory subunit N12